MFNIETYVSHLATVLHIINNTVPTLLSDNIEYRVDICTFKTPIVCLDTFEIRNAVLAGFLRHQTHECLLLPF